MESDRVIQRDTRLRSDLMARNLRRVASKFVINEIKKVASFLKASLYF